MTGDPAPAMVVCGAGLRRSTLDRVAVPAGWILAGVVLGPAALQDGSPALLALAAALAWWVAVVAVVRSDLRDFIIPDGASLAIAALGLGAALGGPALAGEGPGEAGRAGAAALACGIGAFLLFWLVGALFARAGRDALGFGDVKLAGASALWLAPADAAVALEIAALAAAAALLASRRAGLLRDTPVPFGAFMAPAAWAVFVLGPIVRDAWDGLSW